MFARSLYDTFWADARSKSICSCMGHTGINALQTSYKLRLASEMWGRGKIGSKNGLVTRYGIYERALNIMQGGRREFPQWANVDHCRCTSHIHPVFCTTHLCMDGRGNMFRTPSTSESGRGRMTPRIRRSNTRVCMCGGRSTKREHVLGVFESMNKNSKLRLPPRAWT